MGWGGFSSFFGFFCFGRGTVGLGGAGGQLVQHLFPVVFLGKFDHTPGGVGNFAQKAFQLAVAGFAFQKNK